MDAKVLIQEMITVEGIIAVIAMEITTEVETVVVEEIQDAVAVATEAAVAAEEILVVAAAVVATEAAVAAEEILVVAAVAVATEAAVAAEEIQDAAAAAVATMAAVETEEEIQDAAAVAVATMAAVETEEEIQDAAAVAVATMAAVETVGEILDVAAVAEEIPAMEDTVVGTEIHTKVVTAEEILDVMVEEIPAVAETEVETKMIDPIPIKVIEHLSKTTESLLKQNRIILVPTRTLAVVAIVEKQEVEVTAQHILKRRDS